MGTNLRVAQWDLLPEGWCLTGEMAVGLLADNVGEAALLGCSPAFQSSPKVVFKHHPVVAAN